ncbi:uncharacterized protein MCAP_0864-like [Clytia hemisphaerica]
MKKIDPVKIYWEDFPQNSDQFRNVLDPTKFQEPSKILNSTEVTARPKPWLAKNVPRSKVKTVNAKEKEIPDVNVMIANQNKSKVPEKKESVASFTSPKVYTRSVGIKDLNSEDKQKITKLIQELAKFGSEKQKAVKELNDVKENYSSLKMQLQREKEEAIHQHNLMKDKLTEYQILVEEMKSNQQNAQSIMDLDAKSETSLIDNFSDLFLEQEKKFERQQNILQEQIEQLQKLQESVIKQQTEKTPKKPTVGLNSKKLESYLQQSASKHTNSTLADLSMQTESHDLKENKAELIKNSPNSTQLETYNNEQTKKIKQPVKHTVDMEVQTETPREPTLKDSPLVIKSSYRHQNKAFSSRMKCSSSRDARMLEERSTKEKFDVDSKPTRQGTSNRSLKAYKRTSVHSSPPPQKSVCFSKSTTSDEDAEHEEMILVSPLQRKHFKPSSMLELIEGIQPRSTSTSVDQYSMKRSSSLKSRSTTSSNSYSKTKPKGLDKVYGKRTTTNSKTKSLKKDEDMLERKMLDDLFFA